MRSIHRFLLPILAVLLIPSAAFAQDEMTFGGDDEEESVESEESEGDTMDFGGPSDGEDTEGTTDAAPSANLTIAVIAVPTPDIDGNQRRELQSAMQDAMGMTQGYDMMGADAVLQGLDSRGVATCITEPLCLGTVGGEAGVERILMGRVKETANGYSLDVDLFDVEDRLFVKYSTQANLGNFNKVIDAVAPAYQEVFDIRVDRQGPNYGEEANTGKIQTILAYSAAGLAVASLTGGIVFGSQAAKLEDEAINHEQDDEGRYVDYTQVQANEDIRAAQGKAQTANIFYGVAGGLAVISGVLFVVQSGSDVAEGEGRAGLFDRLKLAPAVGQGSLGFGARVDF
ncbi:MAG: hypothetical protein ACQEVA_19990 [Myxococcota bacterium]